MEQHYSFFRTMLLFIAIGVWVIVLQNAGVLPQLGAIAVKTDQVVQIKGLVEVENTVYIKGQVDANLESINGHSKFYKDPRTGEYYVIPVTDPYN